jgi:hypothetical protein
MRCLRALPPRQRAPSKIRNCRNHVLAKLPIFSFSHGDHQEGDRRQYICPFFAGNDIDELLDILSVACLSAASNSTFASAQ